MKVQSPFRIGVHRGSQSAEFVPRCMGESTVVGSFSYPRDVMRAYAEGRDDLRIGDLIVAHRELDGALFVLRIGKVVPPERRRIVTFTDEAADSEAGLS